MSLRKTTIFFNFSDKLRLFEKFIIAFSLKMTVEQSKHVTKVENYSCFFQTHIESNHIETFWKYRINLLEFRVFISYFPKIELHFYLFFQT